MAKKHFDKYSGLKKEAQLKIRHELYEADYLHKLNDIEKLLAK